MLKLHFLPKETGRLRYINNWLTMTVIILALYIMLMPLLPQAEWWVKEESPLQTWTSERVDAAEPIIKDNRLFIPSLGMSQQIHDGGIEQLRKGVWRRPNTSTPNQNSNTVLVGHRFTYDGDGVFYHLDKVKTSDKITVHWSGKAYNYVVDDILVVKASAVEIESPTDDATLTIYTCTPLWSAKDRLVIRAHLEESV